MSKDRDIDDILESLNQLLREGESHNDDHVESDESPAKVKRALDDLQDELSDVSGVAETRFEDSKGDDSEPANDAEPSEDEGGENVSEIKSETEAVAQRQQDEPEEGGAEADSVSDDADGPVNMQRVVLTEEMLVDNPQRSLLSMIGNSASNSEGHAEPTVPQAEPSIDYALMAELLDRVTDDVIRQLPKLIKTSLERHLNSLTQGEKPGDSSDQTEE